MYIKHENGIVTFRMKAGNDFVRSTMPIGNAQRIVNIGKSVVEKDGQIIVDSKYYFPARPTTIRKKQTESDAE